MNAPVSFPCAHRKLWPHIHAAFKRGADTMQIVDRLAKAGVCVTEAEVANALHRIREQARAA